MIMRPPAISTHAHTVGHSLRQSALHSPVDTPGGHAVSKEEVDAQLDALRAKLKTEAGADSPRDAGGRSPGNDGEYDWKGKNWKSNCIYEHKWTGCL